MIAVVGESLVDVVHAADGSVREHPGGSPANVALGLARLGYEVTLLTSLGTDAHGALVRAHLESAGVVLADCHGGTRGTRTSTATAHLDAQGSATYEFDLAWDPGPLVLPDDTRVLHAGSLGLALDPGRVEVFGLMKAAVAQGVAVTFDPNVRPSLMEDARESAAWVQQVASLCHVVKVSVEDLAVLFPGEPYRDVVARWLHLAGLPTALVVVTLGGGGAYAATAHESLVVPAPRVTVADTVGAGDAFTAGLLDALRGRGLLTPEGGRLPRLERVTASGLGAVVRHAMLAATLTVTRPGADPPTRAELDAASARPH